MGKKVRRNISIDKEIDEWLNQRENASELISNLLMAYRAYGGDEMEAVRYILERRVQDTAQNTPGPAENSPVAGSPDDYPSGPSDLK